MTFKTKNYREVTALVKEIQGGADKWAKLVEALSEHKTTMCKAYYRKVSGFVAEADIDALYDDCLLSTVGSYDSAVSDNFVGYLCHIFSLKVTDLTRHHYRQKRVGALNEKSMDTHVSETDSTAIAETFQDVAAGQACAESLMELSVMQDLKKFSEKGVKEYAQYLLLFAEVQHALGYVEDRQTALLAVSPEGTSWEACRQNISRAKKSFKEFCVFCHKVG